jgi:dTDP-4-dehydrorhamnose 3,5-epimerase
MQITRTVIPDVLLLTPSVHRDERGTFAEVFRLSTLREKGIGPFVQENQSGSQRCVLRGLHYQIRQPQGKLVRAVVGEVFDVAVDLRRNSESFGRWVGELLSGENRNMLWIPPGFAHGFYVLSDWAEFTYKTTDYYAPEWERTLLWNDPEVGVRWPLVDGQPPILSDVDAGGLPLAEAENYP